MPKLLNQIPDDAIRWFIDFTRTALASGAAAGPGKRWTHHFALATHLYQQDASSEEVRGHFIAAVECGLEAFERRGAPTEKSSRTPWDFGLVLGVVAAFGTPEQRARAGAVERWKWFAPEEALYMLLADTLEQLQKFLRNSFELEEAARVVARCEAENADRDSVRFNGPLVKALSALATHDEAAFCAALDMMISEHQYRAMRGPLMKQTDGLVAVLPLGLVKLARDVGLECKIDSPYVPVALL